MGKRVHIIGIGGTGMSAIALMLMARGYQVSGSDLNPSAYLDAVVDAGAHAYLGHDTQVVTNAELVLRSSAVKDDDAELQAAKAAGIPVFNRAQFLPQLIGEQPCLAVAGSHGKTTTTAMLIHLLQAAGQDPSYVLGARLKSSETNAAQGSGRYFVIEADEYDNMFLGLTPLVSIITNIQHDHPDCFPTPQDYEAAFLKFASQTTGLVLLCGDDEGNKQLLPKLADQAHRNLTYGFEPNNDYVVQNPRVEAGLAYFTLGFKGNRLGEYNLAMPGMHNILNAAAALAVMHQLDFSAEPNALANFQGTERRFDRVYQAGGLSIFNDYGHHPTQIQASIQAARALYPQAKLWAVWEPHTYSRTRALENEFVTALRAADEVLVSKIYAAREADDGTTPVGITYRLPNAHYFEAFGDLAHYLGPRIGDNDVVLVLSAGKGPELSQMIIAQHQGVN